MNKMSLLDCTLRDGGYINDWEFGHDNLISIFERLVDSGVDIIEVGFLDDRRPYDFNRSIFPDTEVIGKIWDRVDRKSTMIVGMIDYGTCNISNLQPCKESFLDGIRVIFKKGKMYEAMEYCAQLKNLGYKVFSQLVSITAYNDEELLKLVDLVNEVKPYAVSMVDTYGLLEPEKLIHYYDILDNNVDQQIQIGFHAHNNFQLAYANSRAFLEKPTNRNIVIDGTLFGMGKNAGNAPLELLGSYMNSKYGASYNTRSMLESIEESIKNFYINSMWGYKTFFYLCASNECHPSYLEYFQNKGNLSITKLDELLSRIEPEEKKLLYDKELAEVLYQQFVKEKMNDDITIQKLREEFFQREILIIGPGKNIALQVNKVKTYVEEKNPVKIAINYIPEDISVDYVFVTKVNRYREMTSVLHQKNIKVFATSNLECRRGIFDFCISREPLLEQKEEIKDNSFLMLLKILKRAGILQVSCAGLDGYSDREDNYALPGMEYDFVKQAAAHLNRHIKDALHNEYKEMEIKFITYSHYDEAEDINSATF